MGLFLSYSVNPDAHVMQLTMVHHWVAICLPMNSQSNVKGTNNLSISISQSTLRGTCRKDI